MNDLINWILTEGRLYKNVPELLHRLGPELQKKTGCTRIWLGTKVLHPQATGYTWIWENEKVKESVISYVRYAQLVNMKSPALHLATGLKEFRLKAPDCDGMPEVGKMFDRGFVDFFAHSMYFQGEWTGGLTFASKEEFSEEELQIFRSIIPALSAVVETHANKLVTATLLETYLGADAGRRVYLGQVKRGDGQTLRSVVWFSDIRGFTKMSERLPLKELLEVINDAFEEVVTAVENHSGQVLKFIGDGVLAIFPCTNGDAEACNNARAAALQLMSKLETVQIGVGLHLGEVNYGNIGAPQRLDFTVIGSDVNLAARVESQTGKFGKPVLVTPQVAAFGEWESVAKVELKGVAEKVELFAPIEN